MSAQSEFIAYLNSLAPEGEVALLVRQKPQLKNNEMQFHEDGAIKCTWPAMLLTHTVRSDWAIYGNTASFIIDRFKDGHISASAANCEYVLVMVLDDINTPKTKTPPLPPTWIMETSPGCFQWGYAFTEQPTKAEFSAAIVAIAEAGYTDPGAINCVRNFRLPGSVNLKPGRDAFESVLAEFHPEREYTLAQICDALQVVPGPVTSEMKVIRMSDTGADDVLAWLSAKGLLLSRPNAEGWAGVICPNSAAHTDGNPEGRYMPLNRAYCCYHGHCLDFTSSDFLAWVSDQGGPRHAPGLRDELLAEVMDATLSKLAPTDAYRDVAAEVIAEVERKELGRIEKADWYERFAYLQDDDGYFDLQDRRQLSRQTFNALFRHIGCKSIHGKNPKIEAGGCFDENRQVKGAKALIGVTYAAGETVLVARDGLVYGNRWVDARLPGVPGDVSLWLRHVERLVPEAFERAHLLDVLAYKMQHPDKKINHAILIAGGHGAGKDTLLAPWIKAVCGMGERNKSLVSAKSMESAFNYSAEAEVMVINELRPDDFKDRRALENTLKPIIAAPPEYITVNRKGLHPYDALNRVLVVAFSNFRDAIALPPDDRRWFVIWTYAEASDCSALWQWYQAGGFQAVAAWLRSRDVSAFNPAAAPPMTEAKSIMSQQSMSGAEAYILELIQGRQGEFAKGVVGAPLQAIVDRLMGGAPCKLSMQALTHALAEAGWHDMGRIKSRTHDTKKQVYAAPNMLEYSRSELRDMIEAPPPPMMVRVK